MPPTQTGEQAKITDRLIAELGAESTPRIEVITVRPISLRLCPVRRRFHFSATGEGLENLKAHLDVLAGEPRSSPYASL